MKNLLKVSFFIAMILSLGIMSQSCKSMKPTDDGKRMQNISGTWVLKSFNEQDASKIFTRKLPTLTINQATNQISGFGGCNGISGTFTYKDGIFSAPNMISTMMFCEDASQEPQLVKMLGEANKVEVVNGVLTFKQKGKVVAEYIQGIDAESLKGEWSLQSIDGKDVSSLFGEDRHPSIEFFAADNKIAGHAGCNRYNATYQLEGSVITVGPVASTRMACQHMDGEYKFINALSETSSITVLDNTIIFSKAGKETLKFVKK